MSLQEFRDLLQTADPAASHYYTKTKQENYTLWAEYGRKRLMADNRVAESTIKIQVDRYTKIEYDPIADAITAVLDAAEIPHEYLTDFEPDTGYIHHIWDCEVD